MKDLEEDLYDGQVLQKLFGETELFRSDSGVDLLFGLLLWCFQCSEDVLCSVCRVLQRSCRVIS